MSIAIVTERLRAGEAEERALARKLSAVRADNGAMAGRLLAAAASTTGLTIAAIEPAVLVGHLAELADRSDDGVYIGTRRTRGEPLLGRLERAIAAGVDAQAARDPSVIDPTSSEPVNAIASFLGQITDTDVAELEALGMHIYTRQNQKNPLTVGAGMISPRAIAPFLERLNGRLDVNPYPRTYGARPLARRKAQPDPHRTTTPPHADRASLPSLTTPSAAAIATADRPMAGSSVLAEAHTGSSNSAAVVDGSRAERAREEPLVRGAGEFRRGGEDGSEPSGSGADLRRPSLDLGGTSSPVHLALAPRRPPAPPAGAAATPRSDTRPETPTPQEPLDYA